MTIETTKQKLQETLANLRETKNANQVTLEQLEKDFADVKLNPYGITSIDFAKRQELAQDVLKMEGTEMGLELALEILEGKDGSNE